MAKHSMITAGSLLQLLGRYARPRWKRIALLVALTVMANVLLVAQPAVLAALLALIVGQGGSAPHPSAANVFSLNDLGLRCLSWLRLETGESLTALLILSGLYVALALVVFGFTYAARMVSLRLGASTTAHLQSDVLRHLLAMDLRFFHREKSGELLSRLTHDAETTALGLGPLILGVLHHGSQLVIYGLYLVSTSVWLTAGAAAVIVAHFALTNGLKRPVRRLTRAVLDRQADVSTAVQEAFLGIRVIKSFGAEACQQAPLRRTIARAAEAVVSHGRWRELEAPARTALDAVGIIAIFLIAVAQMHAGDLTLQGLLLYVYVGRQILVPANHMATNYLWSQALLASYERLAWLLAQRPQVVDGFAAVRSYARGIEVQGASFAYSEGRPAVEHVSVTIRKGETVALVGPSGAGKSTLTDLILRLYDPDDGRILMDGVDIRTLRLSEYRKLFGVVSQEVLLFHDTVRNNIRYGRAWLTEEDIETAARTANAHDFITRLPEGYDTLVGDRGVRLSGGERQRVAIARAIVHRPEILILDEATSALDSESERQVQLAIDHVITQTTALVIAHRFSTILRANQIVVMDHGRILDIGRHAELLDRCPLYRHLFHLQSIGEDAQPEQVESVI